MTFCVCFLFSKNYMASERHSFYAEHITLGIFKGIKRNKVISLFALAGVKY